MEVDSQNRIVGYVLAKMEEDLGMETGEFCHQSSGRVYSLLIDLKITWNSIISYTLIDLMIIG